MVPKPFFDNEVRPLWSALTSTDNRKAKQKVVAMFGKNKSSRKSMARSRIIDGQFIPLQGLVGSDFWHIYDDDAKPLEMADRAILLQSIQNYRKINEMANFANFPQSDLQALEDPRFGEQVIVDTEDDICIGDEYEVTGSTLRIRISSPRKSTRELDIKNKTPVGVGGIYHLTCSTGMAGWFCEVLNEGTMSEGSELLLVSRPNPKWTLEEISKAIYGGEGDPKLYYRCKPSWGRSRKELEDLLALPYLSECGWKEKLRKIKRVEMEKEWPTPYFDKPNEPQQAIASVLGIYGRDQDYDEYMPRAQVLEASFKPVKGLKGHEFWHSYDEEAKAAKCSERAVLVQSIQSYRRVQAANFDHFPDTDLDVLVDPCFGEQLIIDLPNEHLCVGDVLTVVGSTLKLRVKSPRKPCGEVDNKSSVPYGAKGIRHYTCSKALAGWFCEVVTKGKLTRGSRIDLVERPCPEWPMEEIAMAIYGGEGDPKALNRASGSWGRPMEKFHELLNNPWLAEIEWKDEMKKIARKMKRKADKEAAAAASVPTQHTTTSVVHRRRIGFFDGTNAWIPIILAFIIANISCMVVMASEKR